MKRFNSCQDIARLAAEARERKIPFFPYRLAIAIHHLTCRACRRYERQMRAIERLIARHADELQQGPGLAPEQRDRIRDAMERESI